MPVTTSCSNCRKPLRVGDEMVNRRVRCPGCGTVFVAKPDAAAAAAAGDAAAATPASALMPSLRADAKARTALPGLGLIGNGLLTLALYAAAITFVIIGATGSMPEPRIVQRWNEELERQTGRAIVRVEFTDGFTQGVVVQLVLLVIGLLIGFSVLLAGFQMRGLRNYRNVFVCSLISILPVTFCVWGLPFGIWSLIALRDPVVKSAFES